MICDDECDKQKIEQLKESLRAAGIKEERFKIVYETGCQIGFYHLKLMIIDGQRMFLGTYNFSVAARIMSHEIGVGIESEKVAQIFQKHVFSRIFKERCQTEEEQKKQLQL